MKAPIALMNAGNIAQLNPELLRSKPFYNQNFKAFLQAVLNRARTMHGLDEAILLNALVNTMENPEVDGGWGLSEDTVASHLANWVEADHNRPSNWVLKSVRRQFNLHFEAQ